MGARAGRRPPTRRIALIGETEHDVREVMIEGVSGLLAVHEPDERPDWIAVARPLDWPNGAVAQAFSAEDPEACAGRNSPRPGATSSPSGAMPKRHSTCCSSGCALATRPRQVITTTPRPIALLKRLIADPATA